jgi:hypothetical protein
MSALGPKTEVKGRSQRVRFTLESGNAATTAACPVRDTSLVQAKAKKKHNDR